MLANHTKWMNYAILQGLRSKGATAKNPPVGCVIVKNDLLVSYGKTGLSGRPHAEEEAINNVAYIRYASVYKDFREARDFGKFVEQQIKD